MGAAENILRAMVALPRFTVADLVTACGLPAQTVRTVLRRHGEWFEEVGRAETGKAGGRWKEYRATDAAADAMQAYGADDTQAEPTGVSSGLKAVQELLLASDPRSLRRVTVESLLRRARRFREEVPSAILQDSSVGIQVKVADVLIALVQAELSDDRVAWSGLREGIGELRSAVAAAGDRNLITALEERFESSPLSVPPTGTAVHSSETSEVAESMSGVLAEVVELLSSLVSSYAPMPRLGLAFVSPSRPTGADIAARARRRVNSSHVHEPAVGMSPQIAFVGREGRVPVLFNVRDIWSGPPAWTMHHPTDADLAQDNQLCEWQPAVYDLDVRGTDWP